MAGSSHGPWHSVKTCRAPGRHWAPFPAAREDGSRHVRRGETWPAREARAAVAMYRSLHAEAPAKTWPARLLRFRGDQWLRQQRILQGSQSSHAGRVAARRPTGHVAPRWESEVFPRIATAAPVNACAASDDEGM